MLRMLVGVIGSLTALAAAAVAQSSNATRNYDFERPVYTVVDVATKSVFGGWSGNCNTGRVPVAVTLWRIDPASHQILAVPATLTTGARPDAAAWLAAVCSRPFDPNVGWSLD